MSQAEFCTRRRVASDWQEPVNSSAQWDRYGTPVSRLGSIILIRPADAQNPSERESAQARFERLVHQWRRETKFVSSSTEMVLNSAYQQIIGLGHAALPLILSELESKGGQWFWALRHISGEDPLSPENAGDYEKNREAWLSWGREHLYL